MVNLSGPRLPKVELVLRWLADEAWEYLEEEWDPNIWLINTTTLKLEFFVDLYNARPRRYAILSHTWEDEEVSFQEFQSLESTSLKKGFRKIEMTCRLAFDRGLKYVWMDTCCIDKANNVELTEAINSMFLWYKESEVFFVYLSDLQPHGQMQAHQLEERLSQCRWFTRGWTLQELIAPQHIEILDSEWSDIGQNMSLVDQISSLTGIDKDVLIDSSALNVAVARKMSWAASRSTTRVEDNAYCLIGIFDINMSMIYGEGRKAFYRLQEEIAKETNDLSFFAWSTIYAHFFN
ncbi:HET-domain-containing protein [Mollisia scopiformis]|uniref:HET-domain-containing protein n=1 Tax=Mollisia scopiformis TaxID=149040 RepID=A0A194XKQ8_MOLSC|nr:HET-domain-containing protein [Mollisia scopiformis]KUJ20753.1 HET-domain-containing protein [Mollisia scopiformis]